MTYTMMNQRNLSHAEHVIEVSHNQINEELQNNYVNAHFAEACLTNIQIWLPF
jgi:hypothetical protein